MQNQQKLVLESNSPEDSINLSYSIGSRLKGSEIFELIGDLGSGKTLFVRGLVAGTGSIDDVTSPSFTIKNVYNSKKLQINHFDFYRLGEAGVMTEELKEVLGTEDSVTLIEWGDIVHDVLPSSRIRVKIDYLAEQGRRFEINFPAKYKYLFEGIKRS